MNKCNWKDINYQSRKDDLIKFEKNNLTTVLNVLYAEKEKNILPTFQNTTQSVKNKLFS